MANLISSYYLIRVYSYPYSYPKSLQYYIGPRSSFCLSNEPIQIRPWESPMCQQCHRPCVSGVSIHMTSYS